MKLKRYSLTINISSPSNLQIKFNLILTLLIDIKFVLTDIINHLIK